MVREVNDHLGRIIRTLSRSGPASLSEKDDREHSEIESIEPNEFRADYSSEPMFTPGPTSAMLESTPSDNQNLVISSSDGSHQLFAAGDNISDYYLIYNRYYSGLVFTVGDGHHINLYNDGDVQRLDLSGKTWRFCSSIINHGLSLALKSDLPTVVSSMFEHFRNRASLRHVTKGFTSYSIRDVYELDKADFS